jgi:hypothetical protein
MSWRLQSGLISLADMKMYFAERLVEIGDALGLLQATCFGPEPFAAGEKEIVREKLNLISTAATVLDLPETSTLSSRIHGEVEAATIRNDLRHRVESLYELFYMQIHLVKFLYVKPETLRVYQNPELAGEGFKLGFTNGNRELTEAGNCLALDRFTACVCHLMRALEIGLTSLERQLGIVAPAKGAENTWGKILGRIKDRMDQNDKTPPPDWAKDREFYQKAYSFLQAAKTPLRDSTMHVKSVYDQESATSVFSVTAEVLRHLATRLAE